MGQLVKCRLAWKYFWKLDVGFVLEGEGLLVMHPRKCVVIERVEMVLFVVDHPWKTMS